ncbi:translocation/assembly module TamB domain-containing protein [Shewanella sp. UCD-KL12]|uniref:translocation/assembly module TamB domain-containing protein n=1 Tax=Shewanella sp. UCD-KL12 TaxID=1917163 RepID=UPI0009714C75|nr:translocation/assembly module TamB domain-containing protein [Shewanella sp. UCD-KL12]
MTPTTKPDNTDKQNSAKPPQKRSGLLPRLWKSFKAVSRTIFYIPLGLLVTLAILIGTDIGSRIAVNLADTFVPGLQITYIDGSINNKLLATDVQWQMPGILVQVDDLTLDWHPLCLLRKQLCVDELSAQKVVVEIDTQLLGDDAPLEVNEVDVKENQASRQAEALQDETGKSTARESEVAKNELSSSNDNETDKDEEITLPFGIDLTKADLSNVAVRVNDMHFNTNRLQTQAQWQETGIRVSYLKSQGLLVDIPLSSSQANSQPKDKQQTSSQQETEQHSAQQEPLALADELDSEWAMAALPKVFMPIPVFAEKVALSQSHLRLGDRDDLFEKINFDASYHSYLIHVDSLYVEHTYGKVELNGEISLINDYPMDFSAMIDANHVAEVPLLGKQQLEVDASGGFNKLSAHVTGKGHYDFTLTGDIELANPELDYSLDLSSTALGWPLDTPLYSATDLKLQSDGDITQQNIKFTGNINTPYHPLLAVDTDFSHTQTDVEVRHLRTKGQLGETTLSGKLHYGETISWQADISTIDFDMEQLTLNLSQPLPDSFISGSFNTQGVIGNKHWDINVNQSDLSGEIQGFPFHLIGDLRLDNEFHLSADALKLTALQSELSISGSADKQWAINAQLAIPDLSLWHADSSGSINAKINVSGENDHPEVMISADALDLQFEQLKLEQAKVKGFYRPLDNQEFALSVRTGELQYDSLDISSITLGFKGDKDKQKLGLQTFGELRVNTKIYSQLDSETQQLTAEVRALSLGSKLGDWSLANAFELSWSNQNQTGLISPFCWQHSDGSLCVDDAIELDKSGDASIKFDGDIGAILAPLLPTNLTWQGPASMQSHLTWKEDSKPQGALSLNFSPGHVSFRNNNRNVDIGYRTLKLDASLDEKQLSTQLQFDSHDIASWQGHLDITVSPEHSISGYTKLDKINLDALSEFLPQLAVIKGKISSELQISGTLSDPDVSGKAQLKGGKLLAAANPTLLENIELDVSLAGQHALIDGHWQMGEGQAKLNGDIDWSQDKLIGDIRFNGEELAIIQPPLALLTISPDLNITFDKDNLDIRGVVDLPTGHIKIVQLPEGGIAESKDVVFNDSISSGEMDASPIALTTNIKINVADKLRIDGMGLRGRLTGTLELKQEAAKPPLLYGDIRVVDGKYKFMGQTLDIKAGEVQFIGPLEVPNLNIEAVREIKDEDVVAGVRITGTPLKPVVTLFSTPSKEQAEILSYIIKGTGFHSNDSEQNSGLMLGAALTLSNQIGGGAINNIGDSATGLIEKLGFSNVQLDANDDGKVAISGFIGEDLMVKYGYGVFNPGYEMTVRYYLLSQLYLETVSGTIEQSLDIYYNFDID